MKGKRSFYRPPLFLFNEWLVVHTIIRRKKWLDADSRIMNDEYSRQVLRAVLGSVCQPLGVHGLRSNVCDTLVDVLGQYLMVVGRRTSAYSTHGETLRLGMCG